MFKKILKQGLLMTICMLLFGIMTSNSYAMDYSEKEITLQNVGSEILSEVIFEDRLFNAVSVQTDEEIHDLMVNFGNKWEEVKIHDHGFGHEVLLFSSPTTSVQFKRAGGNPITLKTHIFYYEPEPVQEIGGPEAINIFNLSASNSLVARNYSVIKRSEWGADESLRYWTPEMEEAAKKRASTNKTYVDPCGVMESAYRSELGITKVEDKSPSGNDLTWPLQHMKSVRKFVIHHTDSEIRDINGDSRMDNRDYQAIVRAIYHYHTVSRGWGDIGYNYLIDPLGNIYEGRYGGDSIIGAHALCYNNGTIGISIIGNYQNTPVPEPAQQALISLIASRARVHRIDPNGSSSIRGEILPNVIGHRDIGATSCPGDVLYNLLPKIRERSSLSIRSGSFREGSLQDENLDYNARSLDDYHNLKMSPNERKEIKLQFKNTGKKTWDSNTWLHVALNNDPTARIIPLIENKAFVASDLKERSVAPGRVGTFMVQVEGGYRAGNYTFEVAPVVNGRYKVSRSSVDISFTVDEPNFDYELVNSNLPSGKVFQGQKINAWIELKNKGNIVWKNYGDNQITLGTSGPRDRKSIFIQNNPARIGYLLESEVKPGEIGRFTLELEVPIGKTRIAVEQFIPVIEEVKWLQDKALGFKVAIKEPIHLARIKKLNSVNELAPGEMKRVELSLENRGDLTWHPDNMQMTLLGRGIKVFKSKLISLNPVEPGKTANFSFWIQAPYEEGRHSIFLRAKFNKIPIRGGVARYVIGVSKPGLRAQLVDQGDRYIDLRPGQEKEITVKFKNTGNIIWNKKGLNAVHLGNANPRDRLSQLYTSDGWENKYRPAYLKEDTVSPGEIGTFTFSVRPEDRGIFEEGFQLVLEYVGWVVGGNARWTFRVSGDPVKTASASSFSDTTINKRRAAKIISEKESSVIPTASANAPTETSVSVTNTSEDIPKKQFRVRLSYSDPNPTITANRKFKIKDGQNNDLFIISPDDPISIRQAGNNLHVQVGTVVRSDSVIRIISEDDGIVEIKSWEHRPAWNNNLNDNRFRGVLELRVINQEVAYINELPLEDYIKGLAEVSNNAPFEKQKVIAILARSYARFYMLDENRKFPGMPYDGSDDPAIFQRYLGYGVETRSPNFVGAAAITKNEVVTYKGELVKTPYFNQSDGRTYSAEEVWGWTHTPYLQSVPDLWSVGRVKRGHGVGLSGFGATAQANEGKGYEEIIKYYYQDVQVEELKFE